MQRLTGILYIGIYVPLISEIYIVPREIWYIIDDMVLCVKSEASRNCNLNIWKWRERRLLLYYCQCMKKYVLMRAVDQ